MMIILAEIRMKFRMKVINDIPDESNEIFPEIWMQFRMKILMNSG